MPLPISLIRVIPNDDTYSCQVWDVPSVPEVEDTFVNGEQMRQLVYMCYYSLSKEHIRFTIEELSSPIFLNSIGFFWYGDDVKEYIENNPEYLEELKQLKLNGRIFKDNMFLNNPANVIDYTRKKLNSNTVGDGSCVPFSKVVLEELLKAFCILEDIKSVVEV